MCLTEDKINGFKGNTKKISKWNTCIKWKEEKSIKAMGYGSPDGEEKDWGRATFEEIMM